MGPVKPLSPLAAKILALLLEWTFPLDLFQITLRVSATHEEVEAALAELEAAKRAEQRPRVTPRNWQPCAVTA